MMVIVCYDVATTDDEGPKRLRKIAQACKNFGVRAQYSVFECRLAAKDWVSLRHRLLSLYDESRDSLRFYFLSEDDGRKTEHHGAKKPLDPTEPLIF
jgi:CRISPR-associated protein Cas2